MSRGHRDRVAVITGAAGALGSHFACRLAAEGCHVALVDVAPADAVAIRIEAMGRKAYAAAVDLADAGAVTRLTGEVLERFGRCDILVNNAAHMPIVPLAELTLAEFRRFEAVNVEAALILAQQLAPGMASRGFGRIVQITSSTTGSPMPGFAGYVITKMAGIGLVRALAAELGPAGITVNGISPGLTRTPSSAKNLPQALFDAVCERQLLKRTEVPEDLCGALVFLTSEEAGFITGQILNVDGGVVF